MREYFVESSQDCRRWSRWGRENAILHTPVQHWMKPSKYSEGWDLHMHEHADDVWWISQTNSDKQKETSCCYIIPEVFLWRVASLYPCTKFWALPRSLYISGLLMNFIVESCSVFCRYLLLGTCILFHLFVSHLFNGIYFGLGHYLGRLQTENSPCKNSCFSQGPNTS